MLLLNTIYTSSINNYSKFVKEITLHLAVTFSDIKNVKLLTFIVEEKPKPVVFPTSSLKLTFWTWETNTSVSNPKIFYRIWISEQV